MAILRSINEYRQLQNKRIKALRKEGIKTSSQSATHMQAIARKLAPRKTGETIRGIRKRKKGNTYLVESRVRPKGRSGFRQNLWANRTAPFRSVKMRWSGGRRVVYGDGTHRITGTPRFFHFAMLRSKKHFKNMMIKNTKKALRTTT